MSLDTLLPLIQAVNLTCIREERLLFDELSFAIYPGEIVQIEGENGSGKTSLLRILSSLSQPYEGEVKFKGKVINDCIEEFHQHLSYLGHLPGVKGEMTAEENLQFNLALHGNGCEDLLTSLNKVNLSGFEDSLAAHLSAGQHRRIALANLYQSNALIWILDEPFTAIDKQGVASLEKLITLHAKRGGCVILTTHQDLISIHPDKIKKINLDYHDN